MATDRRVGKSAPVVADVPLIAVALPTRSGAAIVAVGNAPSALLPTLRVLHVESL